MLCAGVLDVIIVKVMTDRADQLADKHVIISGYRNTGQELSSLPVLICYYSSETWSLHEISSDLRLIILKCPFIQC